MSEPFFSIPEYHAYLSPTFALELLKQARPVDGVADLLEVGRGGGLETQASLCFLTQLYETVRPDLARVLAQRTQDRKFIDERVKACYEFNRDLNRDLLDPDYMTVLSLEDSQGRIVFGPKNKDYSKPAAQAPVAPLPEYLKGPHVTLFGPPDSAKMAINAMNAYHRKLPNEPAIVEKLLGPTAPMWGADDEDSKTPLRADLVSAAENLSACFDGTLSLQESGKTYSLAKDHLSLPIKRFPGLALPSSFLFYQRDPIPLHLYDFALHLFKNWNNPQALVFYVPKLENEEEARYIHKMISTAEEMIHAQHPSYVLGTVRLMIVLENPRAILRAHEIIDALHPYLAGASLGWHDYLASTARLFKNDANYRIPVKADPEIVIKYIKASHRLVADVVGSRGGIKVGGMYGILPVAGNPESLQITLKGFFKDVITQLKRELTGFWVAHPDFVRIGLALVEAWKRHRAGNAEPLKELVGSLLNAQHAPAILKFIEQPDIEGLDLDDPGYVRSLIVADIKESDFIANNHPDEIRYNVFQSLQYLTDWLCGNGCVALPTVVEGVPVRVMDDLATAERSRWEVWHELHHGRFSVEEFIRIAHEEMNFIRRDLSDGKKIVQVKWDERTARWYPIAYRIMLQLMTAREPVEFATELLIPFTVESVRNASDPWSEIQRLDPKKFQLETYVQAYDHYFEICGVDRFAGAMAALAIEDEAIAEKTILNFTLEEILSAASFHGDIGQSKKTLDARAASEQSRVIDSGESERLELKALGESYRSKFGFKFLISAQGKSSADILSELKRRIGNSQDEELNNARIALWEISRKRMRSTGTGLLARLEDLRKSHGIASAGIAINIHGNTQELALGNSVMGAHPKPATSGTAFQIASLGKTLASAFSIEYFRSKGIALSSSANELLARSGSSFRLKSVKNPVWGDQVTLADLMSHSALNMHYVNGISLDQAMPRAGELLADPAKYGYEPVSVINEPGKCFRYSGGGFIVLEHLLESLEGKSIQELTVPFFSVLGLKNLSFDQKLGRSEHHARGYFDDGKEVPGGCLGFPAFAAGGAGTAGDMARFLQHLTQAFHSLRGSSAISHDTAVEMLHGKDKGCQEFMGCNMGLGVFVADAGPNRLMIHQGSNEGFRAIFIHCYDGPDQGKGLVIFCNGDNRGVIFISEAARLILEALQISGISFEKLSQAFDFKNLPQEQIVNLGYKTLIFDAFEPTLPEKILNRGPLDPLASANRVVGAKIFRVSNQRFARAENLISDHLPTFDPELFGKQGKIMDSWESARHNPDGYDFLEMELLHPSMVKYVSLSTKFHDGNQAEHVRLLGMTSPHGEWREFLPKTPMKGHSLLQIALSQTTPSFSRIRVEMFPDGGLSRLGLFESLPQSVAKDFKPENSAQCVRFSDPIPKSKKPLTIPYSATPSQVSEHWKSAHAPDPASLAFGGRVVRASNEHYGPAAQVVSPFPPLHMFDGLESARSRMSEHFEEVQIELGKPSRIESIVLDFTYFVNNNPLEVSIEGLTNGKAVELVKRTCVKAFAGNLKEFPIASETLFEQLLIRTYPDGGINRIRVRASAV